MKLPSKQSYLIALLTCFFVLFISGCKWINNNSESLSDVNSLASLTVSAGSLSPAFSVGSTTYSVDVNNEVDSIRVTATVEDASATIQINGVETTSGVASAAIALVVGANSIPVVVTAENGDSITITITVTRAASSNADLSVLVLSGVTLDQTVAATTYIYTASVANDVTETTVTPTTSDTNATVTVDGTAVSSGTASSTITLSEGDTEISVIVTAENGTSTNTYTITVNRQSAFVGSNVMFFTTNWGDDSVKVTDDLLNKANESTVTPDRVIIGANTQFNNMYLDSIFVDKSKNIMYVINGWRVPPLIMVFENATTVTGNVAPDRVITISESVSLGGLEVDTVLDRLYVAGTNSDLDTGYLYIFDNASTLNGTVAPTATIANIEASSISLDDTNDRLFIGGDYNETIYVLDAASTLTSDDTVSRTITGITIGPSSVWIDENTDILYVSSNGTENGIGLFAFDNASTLEGVVDLMVDSSLRITGEAIGVMIDGFGNLYKMTDSAQSVLIYHNVSTLSGDITIAPDLTINGVFQRGYGMHALIY